MACVTIVGTFPPDLVEKYEQGVAAVAKRMSSEFGPLLSGVEERMPKEYTI